MILIDSRAGSCELKRYIQSSMLTYLDSGDVAFVGCGPKGDVNVGIEHKQLSDVLQCIGNGRFSGTQLPRMLESYHYLYLMIEGIWRPDPETDTIQIRKGNKWADITHGTRRWGYQELSNWCNSMTILCGVRILRVADKKESSVVIKDLYAWWSKPWDQHKSIMTLDNSDQPVTLMRPTTTLKMIAQIPGVGWERAQELEANFKSIEAMMTAKVTDFQKVKGIGKVTAESIYRSLRGGRPL